MRKFTIFPIIGYLVNLLFDISSIYWSYSKENISTYELFGYALSNIQYDIIYMFVHICFLIFFIALFAKQKS